MTQKRGKNVFRRFWDDLRKKELALVKIVYFLFVGANSSLFPYMTIHLRSLGITLTETAFIYALLPLISCPFPPIAGYIVDRFGKIKIIFSVCLVLSGLVANCLLLVPRNPLHVTQADHLNMTLSLNEDGAVLSSVDPLPCPLPSTVNVTVVNCEVSDVTTCPWISKYLLGSNISLYVQDLLPSNLSGHAVNSWLQEGQTHCSDNVVNCTVLLTHEITCNGSLYSSHLLTLGLYCVIRLLSNALIGITNMFNESLSLLLVKKHGGDYGFLRLWGSLGASALAPLTGFLIDRVSEEKGYVYYAAAFFVYGLLKIFLAILSIFLPVNSTPLPGRIVKADVKRLLVSSHAVAFLLIIFCAGMLWGLLENYLFIFLDEDLGATKSLMGLTVTVGNVAGMPFYVISSSFIDYIGHANMIVLGMVCYCVRYVGYSFLIDPYWCLPFEALEAVTNGVMMVATVTYAARIASPAVLSTMQGLWAALYFTLGKGVGGLIGGLLMDALGARWMFRATAAFSLFAALIYTLVYHCVLKNRPYMDHSSENPTDGGETNNEHFEDVGF